MRSYSKFSVEKYKYCPSSNSPKGDEVKRAHIVLMILAVVVIVGILGNSGGITGQASKIKSHCCINTQSGLYSLYGIAKPCPPSTIDLGQIPGAQCAKEAVKYRKAPGTKVAVSPTPTLPASPAPTPPQTSPPTPVQVAPLPQPTCADSDNGDIADKKGQIVGIGNEGKPFSMLDQCISVNQLTEYYCVYRPDPGQLVYGSKEMWCHSDEKCENGACIKVPVLPALCSSGGGSGVSFGSEGNCHVVESCKEVPGGVVVDLKRGFATDKNLFLPSTPYCNTFGLSSS